MHDRHSYSVADPERDPRVPWIPPFRLNLACKNRILSNLPEVQQSLPGGTLVLPLQSSYKQLLEHLNLQAWCSSYSIGPRKCSFSAQKWVCHRQSGWGSKFFARFARILGTWILPFESSRSATDIKYSSIVCSVNTKAASSVLSAAYLCQLHDSTLIPSLLWHASLRV